MNILLISLGSRGDINPFLAIGIELKNRGHHVTLITSEIYEKLTHQHGLNFIACSSAEDYYVAIQHPDLYNPRKSFQVLADYTMLRPLRSIYNTIAQFDPKNTIVVGSPLALGARLANEKLHIPFVNACLQPMSFWSTAEPPVFSGMTTMHKLPRFLQKFFLTLADRFVLDKVLAPELNQFRAELNLKKVNHIFSHWRISPDLNIGFFPDWYATPASDWPTDTQLPGFIHFDENPNEPLPENVSQFLQQGEAPIAFTYGTAMTQGKHFFETSHAAARKLNRRAIFLTQHPEQLPALNPTMEIQAHYIPLPTLLPHLAAMIHHGGIGTLSQTLAASIPQLIVPNAHDQFDNAARVEKLGVGLQLLPEQYTVESGVDKIHTLLTSKTIKETCQHFAEKIHFDESVKNACQMIEKLCNK